TASMCRRSDSLCVHSVINVHACCRSNSSPRVNVHANAERLTADQNLSGRAQFPHPHAHDPLTILTAGGIRRASNKRNRRRIPHVHPLTDEEIWRGCVQALATDKDQRRIAFPRARPRILQRDLTGVWSSRKIEFAVCRNL